MELAKCIFSQKYTVDYEYVSFIINHSLYCTSLVIELTLVGW